MAPLSALAERPSSHPPLDTVWRASHRIPEATRKAPPFFRWRPQWSVGIEALDRDHRSMAAMINYLAQRFGARDARPDTERSNRHRHTPPALQFWLNALHERAHEDFRREDALMRATHYPDTGAHAAEHALLLAEYTTMLREITARGDEHLRWSDLDALKQWFMGHTLDMDRRLGQYLRKQGVTAIRPRG
jgi:hemerythrin